MCIAQEREIIQTYKNMRLLFFDEESIYEVEKPYLKFQIAKGNNSKKYKGQ